MTRLKKSFSIVWFIIDIIFGLILICLGLPFIILGFIFSHMIVSIVGIIPVVTGIYILVKETHKYALTKEEIKQKTEREQNLRNPNWLKHQYYEKKRTIQEIAAGQHVNMITIRKLLDKIEGEMNQEEEDSA